MILFFNDNGDAVGSASVALDGVEDKVAMDNTIRMVAPDEIATRILDQQDGLTQGSVKLVDGEVVVDESNTPEPTDA